jgi:hypothetical protein
MGKELNKRRWTRKKEEHESELWGGIGTGRRTMKQEEYKKVRGERGENKTEEKEDTGKREVKEDNIRKFVLTMSTPRMYNSENHHPTKADFITTWGRKHYVYIHNRKLLIQFLLYPFFKRNIELADSIGHEFAITPAELED